MSSQGESSEPGRADGKLHTNIVTVVPESINDETTEKAAFLATFSLEEEKEILRKIDYRFLLLIGMMYLIKQVDTSNAASIKVLQVGKPSNVLTELHMTANQYNWVQSSLYISYILFETPSNLLLKRMSPHLWQSRIFFTWGIVLACHGAIQNKEGYYAARFFLGMMEAGMFPGVMAQLNSWYRSEDMGKAIMWFFAIQNASGIVGSLLVYGISYMDGVHGLSAWRWVYILEGIITIFFSGVVWYILPDYPKSPRSRTWLTEREQNFIEARLSENAPRTDDKFFDRREVIESLKSPLTWSFMLSQTLVNLGGYGLSWYLPTITTNLGFATLPRNQLLNIPPAVASVLAIIFAGWFLKQAILTRPQFIMIIMTGMVVCFILFFSVSSKAGIYVACILGTAFYSVYFIPFWAWRSATLRGSTGTAFTLGLQNCVAQTGGVIGPQLFQSKWAYNGYKTSFGICAAFVISGWFSNIGTWWLTRNVEWDVRRIARLRKQAKKEGKVFAGDDVKVFQERQFYASFWKKSTHPV